MHTLHVQFRHEDGREFTAKIGRIMNTFLGIDPDHPRFGTSVEIDFGGAYHAFAPKFDTTEENVAHIEGILRTVGVEKWEDLVGKPVIALYAPTDRTTIVGLARFDASVAHINELRLAVAV